MIRRIAIGLAVLSLLAVGAVAIFAPVALAYACPRCYGLTDLGRGVHAEISDESDPGTLRAAVSQARQRVADFFNGFDRTPTLLICATEACDRRLGGKGAKARAYGATFIHVSPEGRTATILAHEFSHIETHARIGETRGALGALPAWFDEGLAVIVSRDERYLEIEGDTLQCRVEPDGDLPETRSEWGPAAGRKNRPIYAMAACRVLQWMEKNGGRDGVLALLDRIGAGDDFRE